MQIVKNEAAQRISSTPQNLKFADIRAH